MEINPEDFLPKIKVILSSPDADILKEFIDMLYYRHEEYDEELLSKEDLKAIKEGEEDFRQGRVISLEELEKKLGL
jgi:hypothetical protein